MQENSVSRVLHNDALTALRELPGESVDMVTMKGEYRARIAAEEKQMKLPFEESA